jgi:four helix bundle protein
MKPYERLRAWQASHDLVVGIYQATQPWPKSELYGLVSQARRAAFSIALNISEGSAKRGSREFRRFLDIAVGSMSELTYCLRLARELGYLNDLEWEKLEEQRETAGKLLWRLYQAISKSVKPV